MQHKRREFLKFSSLSWLGIMLGGLFKAFSAPVKDNYQNPTNFSNLNTVRSVENTFNDKKLSIIGLYGEWAASLTEQELPSLSFRKKEWSNIDEWRKVAREAIVARLSIPDVGGMPAVSVTKQYEYDGLHVEELSWQLPYGRPTTGILLKPFNATGKLPAILAFHDHGGNKYFGTSKITNTSNRQHPIMAAHQKNIMMV